MLTIHTLGYQGRTNLGWLKTFPFHVASSSSSGATAIRCSGGIRIADLVVTVSPTTRRRSPRPRVASVSTAPLRDKGDRLVGILNGIDTEEWDPQTDPHLRRQLLGE